MRIRLNSQYEKIKDGSILTVFLSGDSWGKDTGKTFKAIKFKDCLYPISTNFYAFSEKDDPDGYEFEVSYSEKENLQGVDYD